jgi:hypothetical protein
MPVSRQTTSWRPLRYRLLAAVALVSYFVAATGLPLSTVAANDSGPPSASPKGPCGCPIGEQVSGHCCCCGTAGRSLRATAPATEQADGQGSTSFTAAQKPCCTSHVNTPSPTQRSQPKPHDKPWAPRVGAATCQCTTTLWVMTGEVCPPPPQMVWLPCLVSIGKVSIANTSTHPAAHSPSVPPPRVLGA